MPDNLAKAFLWMTVSSMCFTLMAVMVRAGGELPVLEKVFFRNLVTFAITGLVVLRQAGGNPGKIRRPSTKLIWRSIIGLLGVAGFFIAIDKLTLADAAILNKMSPFFVLLFAALFLGERLTPGRLLTMTGAFIGAMLIVKPQFDLSVLPAVCGLGSGICAGAAYTLVRSMKTAETPHRIVFFFSLISTLALTPFMIIQFVKPTGLQWLALLGIGVFAAGGQYCLTLAYHMAPAGRISIVNYSGIVFSLIAGLIIYAEVPDLTSLTGGALIVAMALVNRFSPDLTTKLRR